MDQKQMRLGVTTNPWQATRTLEPTALVPGHAWLCFMAASNREESVKQKGGLAQPVS